VTSFGNEWSTAPYVRMDKVKRMLEHIFTRRIRELQLFANLATSAVESTLTRDAT
jgi:hypothetical protein